MEWPKERRVRRWHVQAAALALVDEAGLGALTMRALAARLDVKAQSLYSHVEDKRDLLAAVHAAALAEVTFDVRPGRGWAAPLERLARAVHGACARHPNAVPLFATHPPISPAWADALDLLLGEFVAAGFAANEAADAIEAVLMLAVSHAVAQHMVSDNVDGWEYVDFLDRRVEDLRYDEDPPKLRHPRIRAAMSPPRDHAKWFDRSLRAMLTGLAAREPKRRPVRRRG